MYTAPESLPEIDVLRSVREVTEFNASLLPEGWSLEGTTLKLLNYRGESIDLDLGQVFLTIVGANRLTGLDPASENTAGKIRIATAAEAKAGTDDTTTISPLKLADELSNYVRIRLDNPKTGQSLIYDDATGDFVNADATTGGGVGLDTLDDVLARDGKSSRAAVVGSLGITSPGTLAKSESFYVAVRSETDKTIKLISVADLKLAISTQDQGPTLASSLNNIIQTVGVPFSVTLPKFLDPATNLPVAISKLDGLPDGVTYNSVNTTISGAGTKAGASNLVYTGTASNGKPTSNSLTLTLQAAAVTKQINGIIFNPFPASGGDNGGVSLLFSGFGLNVPEGQTATDKLTEGKYIFQSISGPSGTVTGTFSCNAVERTMTTKDGGYSMPSGISGSNPLYGGFVSGPIANGWYRVTAYFLGSSDIVGEANFTAGAARIYPTSGSAVNNAPVGTPIPTQTLKQGDNFRLDLKGYATDPDGDPITITLSKVVGTNRILSGALEWISVSNAVATGVAPGPLVGTTSQTNNYLASYRDGKGGGVDIPFDIVLNAANAGTFLSKAGHIFSGGTLFFVADVRGSIAVQYRPVGGDWLPFKTLELYGASTDDGENYTSRTFWTGVPQSDFEFRAFPPDDVTQAIIISAPAATIVSRKDYPVSASTTTPTMPAAAAITSVVMRYFNGDQQANGPVSGGIWASVQFRLKISNLPAGVIPQLGYVSFRPGANYSTTPYWYDAIPVVNATTAIYGDLTDVNYVFKSVVSPGFLAGDTTTFFLKAGTTILSTQIAFLDSTTVVFDWKQVYPTGAVGNSVAGSLTDAQLTTNYQIDGPDLYI